MAKVLKTLADARLVTTEQDSAEVAHEALIREWGTLRKWLDEDREALRAHRHLTESAQEWERRGREAGELYRGARLKGAEEWMAEHPDQPSPLEKEFLRASQNVKKREQVRWVSVAAAGTALLVLVILGITGKLNRLIYRPVDMEEYWVTIPAGKFLMGISDKEIEYANTLCLDCDFSDERPQRWVDLPAYRIGKYEVTNRQYAQCIKAGSCVGSAFGEGKDLHPVVSVTWHDAKAYCEWVGGRLPTEAEWEKAASWDAESQTKFVYPWGNDDPTSALLNYNFNISDTTPVGKYPAGENGLFDMAGNVWEWTSSLYQPYPYEASDGREDMSSSESRVLRGGSWYYLVSNLRTSSRSSYDPTDAFNLLGFRCARSP